MIISHLQLPIEALLLISERQRSYIDEFVFYQYHTRAGVVYLAWYADSFIAQWDGSAWIAPMYSPSN